MSVHRFFPLPFLPAPKRFLAWRLQITRRLRPFLRHALRAAASRCTRLSDLIFGFETLPEPAAGGVVTVVVGVIGVVGGDETTVNVRAWVV
jgi:hypothetical protein